MAEKSKTPILTVKLLGFDGELWTPVLVDSLGRLTLRSNISAINHFTQADNRSATVTTSSSIIAYQNDGRKYLVVCNDSDTTIYLSLGNSTPARINSGIRLNPNGGTFEINANNLFTGELYAIHGGAGSKTVTICEGA